MGFKTDSRTERASEYADVLLMARFATSVIETQCFTDDFSVI
jgi:hypothetical protein